MLYLSFLLLRSFPGVLKIIIYGELFIQQPIFQVNYNELPTLQFLSILPKVLLLRRFFVYRLTISTTYLMYTVLMQYGPDFFLLCHSKSVNRTAVQSSTLWDRDISEVMILLVINSIKNV